MGYRAEKTKRERKSKLLKRALLGVLLFCIVALTVFSAFVPPVSWKYYVKLPKISRRGAGELRIHFVDVGQGDCTLIEFPDGKTMLMDGGDGAPSTKKKVLRYLNALKIDALDYLVVTHAHEDHCGSLNEVLKYKKARHAFLPLCLPEEGSEYGRLYDALMKSRCEWAYGSRKVKQFVSEEENYPYNGVFLSPHADDVDNAVTSGLFPSAEESNVYSLVFYLEYMGVRVLFTADIPTEVEEELRGSDERGSYQGLGVSLRNLDVLKVSHHGSTDASGMDFLNYTQPKAAVISCGANNLYGHPSPTVLSRLNEVGAEVYRTDVQGNIVITVSADGSPYTVTTA